MATFPTAVAGGQDQGASPMGGAPSPAPQGGQAGGSPAIKLAMLGQLISGLAKEFPQAQQGIKMMLDGLRQIQASASSQSSPQQPPAPPR